MIASTKLNTIALHISKALSDNKVTDEEFRLIVEELEKYKGMKEEVRTKTTKKIATETEESLIKRGRQEARESFRNGLKRVMVIPYHVRTPKYNCSFSCIISND